MSERLVISPTFFTKDKKIDKKPQSVTELLEVYYTFLLTEKEVNYT